MYICPTDTICEKLQIPRALGSSAPAAPAGGTIKARPASPLRSQSGVHGSSDSLKRKGDRQSSGSTPGSSSSTSGSGAGPHGVDREVENVYGSSDESESDESSTSSDTGSEDGREDESESSPVENTSGQSNETLESVRAANPLAPYHDRMGLSIPAHVGPGDRPMAHLVTAPERRRLGSDELWDENDLPRPERLLEHFAREGRLHKADAIKLLSRARDVLRLEENVIEVPAPVTVCGDVHGQFFDLLKLFEVGGSPETQRYLFLGDYVDRGLFSIEVLLTLYAFKIRRPHFFFMLRGNHECRHLAEYFTFKEECLYKYDIDVFDAACASFQALPLAALMHEQFFCVHGGISPDLQTLDEILALNRFIDPPSTGPMCDLLWADPMEDYTDDDDQDFEFNAVRGCSYAYGYGAVNDFLDANDLLCVLRAHEAQDEGYRMYCKSPATGFPTVITLFSAPNYLDSYGNKGAVLCYEGSTINIRQFNSSPHPYHLPNFLNVLSWSLPFVAEKVAELLSAVVRLVDDDDEEAREKQEMAASIDTPRRRSIQRRVLAASRMLAMAQTLREERETVLQLKQVAPGNAIPKGLLAQGPEALRKAMGDFGKVRKLDLQNESFPQSEAAVNSAKEHVLYRIEISKSARRSAGNPESPRRFSPRSIGGTPVQSPRDYVPGLLVSMGDDSEQIIEGHPLSSQSETESYSEG